MSKGFAPAPVDTATLTSRSIALLVAEWNAEITSALYEGARQRLLELGWPEERLHRFTVPGSFELTTAARWLSDRADIEAVICLGCVIQGETRHFDFICQAVADGLTEVGIRSGKPVVFGVLTPNTLEQAQARAGGHHGHKGKEAADTAAAMLALRDQVFAPRDGKIGFRK